MPEIQNSTRSIEKATYVPLKVDRNSKLVTSQGKAVIKFGYVQQLSLHKGDVESVHKALSDIVDVGNNADLSELLNNPSLWDMLRSFEGSPLPSLLPPPSVFTEISATSLTTFGKALVNLRKQELQNTEPQSVVHPPFPGSLSTSVNAAVTALNNFEANVTVTPIGMLHLERLEMTPAGIERGELIATIPLAPKERTSIEQKEWSVTSREFTSIVTDSLENYSETGVTEKTDLKQSTDSQTQHSNQFNISSTSSGSYPGFATATVSTNYTSQDQKQVGLKESRDHSVETTKKASSRVKHEHKVTISTKTVTGSSETSTRILENPSTKDPIRIDYFRMMRKWHVGLYRYGLRMTYDIVIPEPGAAMREAYSKLDELQNQVNQTFVFTNPDTKKPMTYSDISSLVYSDINTATWSSTSPPLGYKKLQEWASYYNAQLPPPLDPGSPIQAGGVVQGLPDDDSWHWFQIQFSIPNGYWIRSISMEYRIGWRIEFPVAVPFTFAIADSNFNLTAPYDPNHPLYGINVPRYLTINNASGTQWFMYHYTGQQTVNYLLHEVINPAFVQLTISIEPTPATIDQWISSVWSALYNAAQNTYYTQQQSINTQISALQDQINNVDTLTLRREENDEIMKGVLRWLLGPSFEFMPKEIAQLLKQSGSDLKHGVGFDQTAPNELRLSTTNWTTMFRYQEMVKFINEAIDWDNVLYFLYSYFWDVPVSWDFIRGIKHPDATRQAFLRAGSARIVLTVRNGYEKSWLSFVEQGDFQKLQSLPNDPYMPIAQEIYDYNNATYPGIPPANPGGPSVDQLVFTACSANIPSSATIPASIPVANSTGFLTGSSVVIDTVDSGLQEIQIITSIPDNSHITVKQLRNPHDGTAIAFPVSSLDQSITTTCSVNVPASPPNPVNIQVDDSTGFLVGDYAVIDTIDSGLQEIQLITAVPDGTHVTVKQLKNSHDGNVNAFPVTQQGQKGILVYEWFEHTPTSGTDIAVTSNLTTIA